MKCVKYSPKLVKNSFFAQVSGFTAELYILNFNEINTPNDYLTLNAVWTQYFGISCSTNVSFLGWNQLYVFYKNKFLGF